MILALSKKGGDAYRIDRIEDCQSIRSISGAIINIFNNYVFAPGGIITIGEKHGVT